MIDLKHLWGIVWVKITTADIPGLLNYLAKNGFQLINLEKIDSVTVKAGISPGRIHALSNALIQNGIDFKIIDETGLRCCLKKFRNRPCLLAAYLFIFLCSVILPTRILFVEIHGNQRIPSRAILEVLPEGGVQMGMAGKDIRSERVKNNLLEMIPDLEWAGVQVQGSLANVSIREKANGNEKPDTIPFPGNMVAARDGVITAVNTIRGVSLCCPGQAVKRGDVLISGVIPMEKGNVLTDAKGSVYAKTKRAIRVFTPEPHIYRGSVQQHQIRYQLQIGKKIVKFQNNSGILTPTCDRIYSYKYLKLPGGFSFPVILIREDIYRYADNPAPISQMNDCTWLSDSAQMYVMSQMQDGRIDLRQESISSQSGVTVLQGSYNCEEMVGTIRSEGISFSWNRK